MRKAHINEDNHRQEMPNDRYDVRSRDCHATDAHVSISSPMELVGGASNLLAHEDLELF